MTHTPAVDSLEQKITIRANDIHWFEDAFRAWGNDDFAGALDGLNAAVNHFAALTRPAGGSERLRELAVELATAENAYRDSYQYKGPDHIETGRAWDRMRKAGDKLREALASPQGAEQRQEGPDYSDGCDLEGFVGGCARMGCHPTATQGDAVELAAELQELLSSGYKADCCNSDFPISAARRLSQELVAALSSPPGVQAAQVSDGMKELLHSTHEIALRGGADTNWEALAKGIAKLGIGPITARHYFAEGTPRETVNKHLDALLATVNSRIRGSAAHGGEVSNG